VILAGRAEYIAVPWHANETWHGESHGRRLPVVSRSSDWRAKRSPTIRARRPEWRVMIDSGMQCAIRDAAKVCSPSRAWLRAHGPRVCMRSEVAEPCSRAGRTLISEGQTP
jgi:hypothetical protein